MFRTTRVRTTLKNDASWILKPKDEEEEQDKAGTNHTERSRSSRQNSYVLSAARKFGAIDSSVSSSLQKTEVTPSEGPQATTEAPRLNADAHSEKNVGIGKENGEAAVDKPSVEQSDGSAGATADVPVEDSTQSVSLIEKIIEAVSPVEPPEQPLSNTTSEKLEEHADAPADPSNTDNSEVNVAGAANVENVDNPSGEIPPVDETVETNGTTGITAAPSETAVEEVGPETSAQPEVESCAPAEQAAEEIVAASPEVTVESSTETIDVKMTASAEQTSVETSVESVPDIVQSVTEAPSEPASEITAEDSSSQAEAEVKGTEEIVAAAAEIVVESLPETTQEEEEAAPHNTVQTVPDIVSKTSALPDAETPAENINVEDPAQAGTEETVEAAAEAGVDSSRVISAVDETTQEEDAASHNAVTEPPDAAADVESVECKDESAAQEEPVLKATTVEVVQYEVHSFENTTVEESIDPKPESEAAVELNINDALEPVVVPDVEAVQENVGEQVIKLTDALDVEIPENKTVPEPVEEPKPAISEELQPSQQCNGTETSEEVQKPAEELMQTTTQKTYRHIHGICSFCDQKINGTVKISLSDPLVECHPECLKCGICALDLGDLIKPMFLRGQMIQCGSCATQALRI